jgi:hypothetical protein
MSAFVRLVQLFAASAGAAILVVLTVQSVAAIDPGLDVRVDTWTSDNGHAYVGVKAAGRWAPPGTTSCVAYYSTWNWTATIYTKPIRDEWFVLAHTCSGSVVNLLNPVMVLTSRTTPGIGIVRRAAGDMSLYLSVSVAPVTAPAGTPRTVTAELTAGWQDALGDAIQAYVLRGSLRIERWTVDFGDGTRLTFPANTGDRLTTTHVYAAGQFDVTVTAHVTGDAYGAFFAPDGTPFERVVPFALDISNRAAGNAALPIDYSPPVVTVGGSPSGTLPNGVAVPADGAGHAALWWPRGLPCALYVRPIIEREGFMSSGGLVMGGATTRLVSYRYEAGTNDASGPTGSGTYPAATPLHIGWDTPLPGLGSYPVRLVLNLETTYDDGTVRTSQVSGVVSVTVIYSAVSQ